MTQNTKRDEVLDMLIEISRYGARFYEQSAERVQERPLKALFLRMAEAKQALVRNFTTTEDAGRERLAAAGSLVGEFQRNYADIRTRIGSGQPYLPLLAKLEQQLLKAIDKQVFEPGTPLGLRTAAALCMPPLQGCVDELTERKQAEQKLVA